MSPKEQFTSQQEASLAVALGVLVFNNGIESTLSKLMPMINVAGRRDCRMAEN